MKLQWSYFDQPQQARSLTVVVVLSRALQGNLRELLQRRHFADHLILVAEPGYWPGADSFGDLALAASRLGWGDIRVCRDLVEAISEIATQRLLVFMPQSDFGGLSIIPHDLAGKIM
jgi:hypothetical protein